MKARYNGKISDDEIETRFGKAYDDAYDVVTCQYENDDMKIFALMTEKKRLFDEARYAHTRGISIDTFMLE